MRKIPALLAGLALSAALGITAASGTTARVAMQGADAETAREAIERAREQARQAALRGERLEAEATVSEAEADRAAREAAALAARVQQAEAEREVAQLQLRTVRRERVRLERDLATRQRPVLGLTAALQRLSRTPPAFAILRPGSVEETVRARALMSSMLPVIEQRTQALRGEIAAIREIELRELAAAQRLEDTETRLAERRDALLKLETDRRLASRRLGNDAAREEERALAMAEEARDLGSLVDRLDGQAAIRQRLSLLPGPKVRPQRPGEARVTSASGVPARSASREFALPANGQLAESFGGASRGVTLTVESGAAITAPGAGRVAFAGPYSGYGRIVIVEHEGGWTSLVTGLGRLDVEVGEQLVAGASLGIADPRLLRVIFELRRDGTPVDPLANLR